MRAAICLWVGLGLILAVSHVTLAASRPHVILLYADDMGYGDLAVQNPESRIKTPSLDRLAREGMRFTDAHSSSAICSPSRYALLTGRFHWRKFHDIVHSFGPPRLEEEEWTMARMFQKAGYRTACIGKWHLGWNWRDLAVADEPALERAKQKDVDLPSATFDWSRRLTGGPCSHGFDEYFGDDVPNFPPYAWFENDRLRTVPSEPLQMTGKTAEGNWETRPGPMTPGWDFYQVVPQLADRTVQWLEQQDGAQPFFLYVPFNGPHAPIVPADTFQGRSQAGGYGDFVEQLDATVGRILSVLDERDWARNTIVIFTSDNGPEGYAYERFRVTGHRSAGPLRGLKRDLYEGGHRVPLVVRWPDAVPQGTVHEGMISQVDLAATLANIVGAPLGPGIAEDSYDCSTVWLQQAPSPRHSIVHSTWPDGYAIRHDQFVLIDRPSGTHTPVPSWYEEQAGLDRHDQPGELYDLHQDLGQRTNLFAEMPEKVAELRERLRTIRERGQVRP